MSHTRKLHCLCRPLIPFRKFVSVYPSFSLAILLQRCATCTDEYVYIYMHKCCAQLCLYKLVMPEREVVVCFADEGQQARNSCPELPIFSFLSWHHMVYCYMYVWVCGVYRESCLLSCHSPLSVVHATFEKTNYVVGEGEGTFQVCVVLSIAAVRNVTVMVTGGEIAQWIIREP